jgi:hypothetical protein
VSDFRRQSKPRRRPLTQMPAAHLLPSKAWMTCASPDNAGSLSVALVNSRGLYFSAILRQVRYNSPRASESSIGIDEDTKLHCASDFRAPVRCPIEANILRLQSRIPEVSKGWSRPPGSASDAHVLWISAYV